MHLPREAYPIQTSLDTYLPDLRPAQRRALTWWVLGSILAGSACQTAVVRALTLVVGHTHRHALRQGLREVVRDGADQAVPSPHDLVVTTCFAPLLRWVLSWWQGDALPLALDATTLCDRLVVLSISVLYRGTAIPVAWHVLPANRKGAWLPPTLHLVEQLAPAIPPEMPVLLLADRGLWSGRLWDALRHQGWHPLVRIRPDATFRPQGGKRVPARTLVPGAGHAWVGTGTAFKHRTVRREATLVVTWEAGQTEPWLVLTDLAPTEVGPCWYGLRVWVELGFRALKSMGWQWERTRRTDPERVSRHWLILAVATLWTVATGTREEDAERVGRDPAHLRIALPPPPGIGARRQSVFARGMIRLRWQLLRTRRLWTRQWLCPDPWPQPPPGLSVVIVHSPLPV